MAWSNSTVAIDKRSVETLIVRALAYLEFSGLSLLIRVARPRLSMSKTWLPITDLRTLNLMSIRSAVHLSPTHWSSHQWTSIITIDLQIISRSQSTAIQRGPLLTAFLARVAIPCRHRSLKILTTPGPILSAFLIQLMRFQACRTRNAVRTCTIRFGLTRTSLIPSAKK